MQSPWMRRAREKPLGYPGRLRDHERPLRRPFRRRTLFAKAVNLAFVSTPAAAAVRERKDLMKSKLARAARCCRRQASTVRILSIAAGPAQEIFELLHGATEPCPVNLENRAVRPGQARARVLVRPPASASSRRAGRTSARRSTCTTRSSGCSGTRRIFSGYGEFDAIFSCGLFDYLQHRPRCRSDAEALYANLVARRHASTSATWCPANQSRWFMELHLDWYLVYTERVRCSSSRARPRRTRTVAILEEATGVNPFVALTRS